MPSTLENFTSAGNTFEAEIFQPATPNTAIILIAHGSDGVVNNQNGPWLTMMTDYAQSLADKGFTVLLPYYFGKDQTVDFLQVSTYQATLADAIAQAKTLPSVDKDRIGLLGFSLGGHLVLRNRALAKVVVEFFAPLFSEGGGIGVAKTPKLPVQIHHGKDDGLVDLAANATPIALQLRSEGAEVDLHEYDQAGHGFNGSHPGDAKANTEAKASTLAFFATYL